MSEVKLRCVMEIALPKLEEIKGTLASAFPLEPHSSYDQATCDVIHNALEEIETVRVRLVRELARLTVPPRERKKARR